MPVQSENTMSKVIDVLLLLALPASGKSEVRRYLASLSPTQCRDELHLGHTVQLDDYPYVHMMRRVSQELRAMGRDGLFFDSDDLPMKETRDWGTLVELVNEDFDDLLHRRIQKPASAATWLLDRLNAARVRSGAAPSLAQLPKDVRAKLVEELEGEAREMVAEKNAGIPESLAGRTVVIEMARGGPENATLPLPAPLGYQYALATLSDAILSRASILYVWVTPEESRRKNTERAKPGREGQQSILHHGVPLAVMLGDYGIDDMDHLIRTSGRPDTVRVETRGHTFLIPVGRFDNRADKTTFVREDRSKWPPDKVKALHEGLADALRRIAGAGAPMKD